MPIDRGCIYEKAIQFKNRSDGQPVDISTWQFEASLKDASGADVLAMTTGGGHFTVTDGPNGWLNIAMTPAETTALVAGPVTFTIYRTDGDRRRYARASDTVRDPE